jgi:predicted ArsR family transcriptional regulator
MAYNDWLERHKQKSAARRSRITGYLGDQGDASGVELFQALKINTSYLYRDLDALEQDGSVVSYDKTVDLGDWTSVVRKYYRLVERKDEEDGRGVEDPGTAG